MRAQWKPIGEKPPVGTLIGMVVGALLVVVVAIWLYFRF